MIRHFKNDFAMFELIEKDDKLQIFWVVNSNDKSSRLVYSAELVAGQEADIRSRAERFLIRMEVKEIKDV